MPARTKTPNALQRTRLKECRNADCTRIGRETSVAVTGATEVHRALCAPEVQRIGAYEIASRVVPAGHVAGDFVCTFQLGNQTFALLGDLMGKGLSAAMWITHIVDLVHRAAEDSQNVCDLLTHLNSEILNSRVRAPLTSAVALTIDHTTGVISTASAGHPPAFVVRSDCKVEMITEGGPLLGVFSGARYGCGNVYLHPGESIVAFSDGLVEAHNSEREEFAVERAVSIARATPACAASKVTSLLSAAQTFASGNSLDDISLLVVQRSD